MTDEGQDRKLWGLNLEKEMTLSIISSGEELFE
jgi:hypothetical protein